MARMSRRNLRHLNMCIEWLVVYGPVRGIFLLHFLIFCAFFMRSGICEIDRKAKIWYDPFSFFEEIVMKYLFPGRGSFFHAGTVVRVEKTWQNNLCSNEKIGHTGSSRTARRIACRSTDVRAATDGGCAD